MIMLMASLVTDEHVFMETDDHESLQQTDTLVETRRGLRRIRTESAHSRRKRAVNVADDRAEGARRRSRKSRKSSGRRYAIVNEAREACRHRERLSRRYQFS